ncbi:hypothetical protein GGE65_006642 [Skermanella aerolata]|uniref:Lipoprotein n=1 Tax=Skermanella aerolata TaxID=393310 RepID=A0A512DYM0_9PROT|nr:hypothetical protein [Skermanella aerolata]KJB93080.1 hypothetical protein N826_18720 [Skermanella aerolata KACC 11604]GEO41584.1 hypothetical protein SAE02_57320 [Skermanella aerolata]
MKTSFKSSVSLCGILLCSALLAGCAETSDPVLETAKTPLMLGETPADKVVSLQTRTMLAGLACGPAWGDPQAFARYASFTVRNAAILRSSQRELADRMGSMAEFDQMHTRISNGESMRMLRMGNANYCALMREPFYVAVAMDPEGLTRESQVAQISQR